MISFKVTLSALLSSALKIGRPTTAGKMASGKLVPEKPHLTYYTNYFLFSIVFLSFF
jgi:hypothetical protein